MDSYFFDFKVIRKVLKKTQVCLLKEERYTKLSEHQNEMNFFLDWNMT